MPRLHHLAVLTLVAAWAGLAQAADPPSKASKSPQLWVKSKEIDFGEVMHGKQVKVDVPIENRGTAPLLIRQVKPSCDCTVAGFPKRIEPGQKGMIKLAFDSNKRPAGYQSFRIAIYSNDPKQADLGGSCTLLSLRGEVRTLYRKAPHGAYFGEFIQGLKPVKKSILVTGMRQARGGFTATRVGTLPDYLKVELKPLPAKSHRKGVRVYITLLPHAPLGSLMQWVEFKTSIKEQASFRLMVSALVNTRITGPSAVNFGAVLRSKGAERVVGIERRDGGKGIPIGKLRVDARLLEVERRPLGPTRVELTVRVKAGARPGPFATFLEVLLDDPHQPMVRIPIYGRVEPRVRVSPSALLLPATILEQKLVGRLIQVRFDGPGKVTRVEVVGKAPIKVHRVERASPESATQIALIGTGPAPTTWPKDLHVVIHTDVPGEERTVLPLVPR